MKICQSLLFFLFLISCIETNAQEVVYPLSTNQQLQDNRQHTLHRVSSFADTVTLPFIDDFSKPGMYPDDSLWLDNDVYINNNYSLTPVTIGIATFDGLNEFGSPYHPSSSGDSIADILTSRPINLGGIFPGDTSVWLSFFYQPEGLGDVPESADSLILQFRDTGNVWTTVWSVPGRNDTAFQRVNIHLTDQKYFFNGFQLRFYNIATVNGNRDHWNLDYVYLDDNTTHNFPIADYALIAPQRSLLNEFSSMPYTHYKSPNVQGAAMRTDLDDSLRGLDNQPTSVLRFLDITDNQGLNSNFSLPGLFNVNPWTVSAYNYNLNGFSYPFIYPQDSAEFLVKSYITDSVTTRNHYNDTSYYTQKFHNYYAYDDGSVEVAYGITGNSVAVAYLFDVKMQDTLRGVQIYFNPTGVNVSNKLFQLTAWTEVNEVTNQAVELYRMINQKPDTFDGINAFKTYLFDTTLIVGPGPIWVGFIQNEPLTLYGIGLDRNTDSRDKMYRYIDGFWAKSSIQGSWMMRPIFGRDISLVGTNEIEVHGPAFELYPNPAQEIVHVAIKAEGKYRYELIDCLGSLVKSGRLENNLPVGINGLSKGIYLMRVIDQSNSKSTVKKLIVG